ncbi:PH domain-containing protein [Nocardioides sp. SYSU DS0651]|uniref:PH domain-containing protein n=1 Tax=Nocardioides sp. SYSU DS0651 TaxID=3415955 RepID=UPI003F4BF8B9
MTWQRLDPRMLLVHPIREVGRFLPVLIGIVVAGGASGAGPWTLLGVLAPVAVGVVRYLTTSWRIAAGRVELRRGVLQRHALSAAVDRVRTVDLTASPIHRVLGLTTVVIGTGSAATDAAERLELDALPRQEAARLRAQLLEARQAVAPGGPAGPTGGGPAPAEGADAGALTVARFSPGWLRYAPFSNAGLVAGGAAIGGALQLTEVVQLRVTEDDLPSVTGALVGALVVGALALAVVLTVAGYLVTNGGFLLSREGAAWHVRRGLLTRRETSIDIARLAGVRVGESAAMRVARGRRLDAIVTGLRGGSAGSAVLLPPAPAAVVRPAAAAVLGSARPLEGALIPHGPAAVRRRYVRAVIGALPVVALAVTGVVLGAPPWLLVLAALAVAGAVALARDRAASLGHACIDRHVVMRSGSLTRSRDALAADHVIGWNLRDTWFQRRAGLVTVTATTAGGSGRIQVYDAPPAAALALAEAATPGLLAQFAAGPR